MAVSLFAKAALGDMDPFSDLTPQFSGAAGHRMPDASVAFKVVSPQERLLNAARAISQATSFVADRV